MGEAKRRKQLNLMPQVTHLKLNVHGDELELLGNVDEAVRQALLKALRDHIPFGEYWHQHYRSGYVGAGKVRQSLRTRADVERLIPVPEYRRYSVDFLTNYTPDVGTQLFKALVPLDEQFEISIGKDNVKYWLNISEPEFSFDEVHWASIARGNMFEYFINIVGVLERLEAEEPVHTIELYITPDQIRCTPEMPEYQKDIEKLAQELYGYGSDQKWKETFLERQDFYDTEESDGVPQAYRARLNFGRLKPVTLLPPFFMAGDLEIDAAEEEFTLDGVTWHSYSDSADSDEIWELLALLSELEAK